MQIEIAGQKGKLWWEYGPIMSYAKWCAYKDPDDPTDIDAAGVAFRSRSDNHCKEVARKVSLTRLLSSLNLTKQQRKEVWNQYRNRRNH